MMGVSDETVVSLTRRGHLYSLESRSFGSLTFTLYVIDDIKQLMAKRRRDKQVERFFGEHQVLRASLRRGLTIEQAEVAAQRAQARKQRHQRVRIGTGRPRSTVPPAHHLEWLELFLEQEEMLRADGEQPRRLQVALQVALTDVAEHPERWDGYVVKDAFGTGIDPLLEKRAAERVWKAVKSLQSRLTETHLG